MTPAIFIAALYLSAPASAIAVQGQVTLEVDGIQATVKRFDHIPERAIITTGENGGVSLRFKSGSVIRLAGFTQIQLSELVHGETAGRRKERVRLITGKLWARVMKLFGRDSHFEIFTKHAVAGVRGTEFGMAAFGTETMVVVDNGRVHVARAGKSVSLRGRGASATVGGVGTFERATLDSKTMDQLALEMGGAGSAMMQDFRNMRNSRIMNQKHRQARRQALQNPEQFTQTDLEAQRSGNSERGRVMEDTARVQVLLEPDRSAGGSSPQD